ncbi:hypothetical protein [Maribacter thermophilus]|uniref:hypothetical protein n=1 Tax=Maribacter thermophilus TaxID=1197874 RepID=UPI000641287B|nr:hypothetical protein [Maribacter thermophilus]
MKNNRNGTTKWTFYKTFDDYYNSGIKTVLIPAVLENYIVKEYENDVGVWHEYGLAICHVLYNDGSDDYLKAMIKSEDILCFENLIGCEIILRILLEGELTGHAYVEEYNNRNLSYLQNINEENNEIFLNESYLNYFKYDFIENDYQSSEIIENNEIENQDAFLEYIEVLLDLDDETWLMSNIESQKNNHEQLKNHLQTKKEATPFRALVVVFSIPVLLWFTSGLIHSGGNFMGGLQEVWINIVLIPIAAFIIYIVLKVAK